MKRAGGFGGVALSSDGLRALSFSQDGRKLDLWNIATGRLMHSLVGHTDSVKCVAISADGLRAASTSFDGTLRVWEVESGRLLHTLVGNTGFRVAMSRSGHRAITSSLKGDSVDVWDLKSGRIISVIQVRSRWVDLFRSVAISHDGRLVITGSHDNALRVWNLSDARCLATFFCDATPEACAFVSDNGVFAGDAIGRVHLLALEFHTDEKQGQ
jgi:WD40 repeat protein